MIVFTPWSLVPYSNNMKYYRVTHDRGGCIGCGSCEYEAPQTWELSERDGLSLLKHGKQEGRYTTVEIDEFDFEDNKRACDNCPVKVIAVELLSK